jgi:serine/threonine-protein kinase
MATVYLAHDLRHERAVALKVLDPDLAAALGAERFLTEIKTTATLQHPHILSLYDSGEAEGTLFYAMPFIDGESLRERIDRERQLPIEDAVRIGREIASGLQAAHAAGVVHRDVKPGNILLGSAGAVIADFGIALALQQAEGERLTKTGLSVGTPHYMSPEQATGDQPLDARSDVYSLGCVLYEMLVGEPPHTGKSVQSVVAGILSREIPRPRATRATIPQHVDSAIRKSLERAPADRFGSCGEFATALADPTFRHGEEAGTETSRALKRWRATAVVALVALPLVMLGQWWLGWGSGSELPPVARFTIPFGGAEGYATQRSGLAISRDGSHIAFVRGGVGRDRLVLRARDRVDDWVVPGSEGALDPFFSPDGRWVGFATVDALYTLPLTGGAPQRIAGFSEAQGPRWAEDGWIYFGSYSGLWRVPQGGGEPEQLTELRSEREETIHARPLLLNDGQFILFSIGRGAEDTFEIASLSRETQAITVLTLGVSPEAIDGVLLFGRPDGTLVAAPLQLPVGIDEGRSVTLVEGIVAKPGVLEYAIADDGTLTYEAGSGMTGRLVLVDRYGGEEAIEESGRVLNSPRFSPDGRRASVGIGSPPTRQVWVIELGPNTLSPLTYEGHNYYGTWSAAGDAIYFTREYGTSADVWSRRADGSGSARPVLRDGGMNYPEGVARTTGEILIRTQDAQSGLHDVAALDPATADTRMLLSQPANEESPAVSPDGAWLAYSSDLSGQLEVYVTTFPEPGGRSQISLSGGSEPVWSPDGRELFYWQGDTLLVAGFDVEAPNLVSSRDRLLSGPYARWPFHANYDIHPDGTRFLMIRRESTESRTLVVVLNWLQELRRGIAQD